MKFLINHFPFVVVQLLSGVRFFASPWTAPLSFTVSQSLLRFVSIESMMLSNHLILCHLFPSCLSSFPASGSFQMSSLFASGGQSIGASASASVLVWFDLLAVQGTLKSPFQNHDSEASILQCSAFFIVQLFTSIHDYWKNHSLFVC